MEVRNLTLEQIEIRIENIEKVIKAILAILVGDVNAEISPN